MLASDEPTIVDEAAGVAPRIAAARIPGKALLRRLERRLPPPAPSGSGRPSDSRPPAQSHRAGSARRFRGILGRGHAVEPLALGDRQILAETGDAIEHRAALLGRRGIHQKAEITTGSASNGSRTAAKSLETAPASTGKPVAIASPPNRRTDEHEQAVAQRGSALGNDHQEHGRDGRTQADAESKRCCPRQSPMRRSWPPAIWQPRTRPRRTRPAQLRWNSFPSKRS